MMDTHGMDVGIGVENLRLLPDSEHVVVGVPEDAILLLGGGGSRGAAASSGRRRVVRLGNRGAELVVARVQQDLKTGRAQSVNRVLEHEAGALDPCAAQLRTVQQSVRTEALRRWRRAAEAAFTRGLRGFQKGVSTSVIYICDG